LPELLEDFVAGDMGPTFLAEFGTIGGVFVLLVRLRLVWGDASGVYLLDGLIRVVGGILLVEGGHIFVNFLEGFFHFDF
jgi:hypothetical protein